MELSIENLHHKLKNRKSKPQVNVLLGFLPQSTYQLYVKKQSKVRLNTPISHT